MFVVWKGLALDKNRTLRSIGTLLVAAASLCGLIAYEKYRSAVVTAEAFSQAVDGIEFQATVPIEAWVAGFLAVLLATAGVRCLLEWNSNRHNSTDGQFLPPG